MDLTINELVEIFNLNVAAGQSGLNRPVRCGYCGDLLSDVMGNAPVGCIWLTVQGHQNIVAVALLREIAAIVITGGQIPDKETLQKADQENIPILLWPGSSFNLAGQLYAEGVKISEQKEEIAD